jgi:acetyl-CoA carboxylase biotin carboxyl carrier protein
VTDDPELLSRLVSGELRTLLRLLDGSDVEELELELGDTKLAFKRDLGAAAPATAAGISPSEEQSAGTTVVAERVGFFHFPEGNQPQAGDHVKVGQVVGVIDSLNVPTPVPAPHAGRIDQVLVEDGQPVEYGQPLLVIQAEEG